ncbi:jg21545 [Pararge aegeria aegeria]|uniref:Jg21545 protein n=1 Tax=Pararge aegeria aegeria TaxID=348720 RepID=A0A8S4RPI8_9NEOP|nr:jg21545 [Pararge aegeria aegeria]
MKAIPAFKSCLAALIDEGPHDKFTPKDAFREIFRSFTREIRSSFHLVSTQHHAGTLIHFFVGMVVTSHTRSLSPDHTRQQKIPIAPSGNRTRDLELKTRALTAASGSNNVDGLPDGCGIQFPINIATLQTRRNSSRNASCIALRRKCLTLSILTPHWWERYRPTTLLQFKFACSNAGRGLLLAARC